MLTGVLRCLQLAVCVIASALVACASDVRVHFDPSQDFSGVATWSWLPPAESGTRAVASDPRLAQLLRTSVEGMLGSRGLVPARRRIPDLLVRYRLEIVPVQVSQVETGAMRFVPSLSFTPSYEVSTQERRLVYYEQVELRIEIFSARDGHLVWRGVETQRVRGRFAPHAEDSVAAILAQFPPPDSERLLTAQR